MQELEPTHQNHLEQGAKILLVSFLISDFFIRGYLWKIVQKYSNEETAYKVYWICDSVTYMLAYWSLLLLVKKTKFHWLLLIAFPFSINKVIESIFTDKSKFDFTEFLAFGLSLFFVYRKLRGQKRENKINPPDNQLVKK